MDLKHGTGLALGTSRGRRSRGRHFIRDHATIEREHRALELLVKGMTYRAIAAELEMSVGGVAGMIKRALEYRANALGPTVRQAATLMLERYERLLERWWPLATGDYVDPETGLSENVPNPRALDGVLRILSQQADLVTRLHAAGQKTAPADQPGQSFTGGIHVHSAPPAERDQAIAAVLHLLSSTRQKHDTIEGQLADARTSLAELADGHTDDRPAPPTTRENAA